MLTQWSGFIKKPLIYLSSVNLSRFNPDSPIDKYFITLVIFLTIWTMHITSNQCIFYAMHAYVYAILVMVVTNSPLLKEFRPKIQYLNRRTSADKIFSCSPVSHVASSFEWFLHNTLTNGMDRFRNCLIL